MHSPESYYFASTLSIVSLVFPWGSFQIVVYWICFATNLGFQVAAIKDNVLPSLPIQRPGLETRGTIAHRCHYLSRLLVFCASISVLWRLCAGGLRVCRVPIVPVFQPAHSCHPFAWKRTWRLFSTLGVKPMSVSNRSYPRSTVINTSTHFGGAQ